jgi:chromosome partitioning protein
VKRFTVGDIVWGAGGLSGIVEAYEYRQGYHDRDMSQSTNQWCASGPANSLRRIAVMNPKGGCGKTTVATNLASLYASRGWVTALFDYDPLGASMRWLRARSGTRAAIHGVAAFDNKSNVTRTWQLRLPEQTQRVIVDTPAGVERQQLTERIRNVDIILIPVLSSPIDIGTTADFIRDLLVIGKVRTRNIRLGIITNRTKPNTRAFQSLERFLRTLNIPVVAHLRDTQNYVTAVQQGLGVHELKSQTASTDTSCWNTAWDWLEGSTNEPDELVVESTRGSLPTIRDVSG